MRHSKGTHTSAKQTQIALHMNIRYMVCILDTLPIHK